MQSMSVYVQSWQLTYVSADTCALC